METAKNLEIWNTKVNNIRDTKGWLWAIAIALMLSVFVFPVIFK
jgi:hypothetical protein